MKKTYTRYILPFFLLLGFITGCETDFDVNAPYKDITIVYGILNLDDSISYVKINKAFLGEGDAIVMAGIPDSSYYPFEDLQVRIDEYNAGGPTGVSFSLDTTLITNKDTNGIFYAPEQYVYSFVSYNKLSQDNFYKLIISNIKTHTEVSSETGTVGRFSIYKPLYNPGNPLTGFNSTIPYTAEWRSAVHGKLYQLTIRFHYREKYFDNPDTLDKYVDWVFSPIKSLGLDGGEKMELKYNGEGFFSIVSENILPDPDVDRFAGMVDFIISVAGDDLNTYMEVNEPSGSIVQERPEFTNIVNGYGLFSSRFTKMQSYNLNTQTVTKLQSMDLGF